MSRVNDPGVGNIIGRRPMSFLGAGSGEDVRATSGRNVEGNDEVLRSRPVDRASSSMDTDKLATWEGLWR